MFDLEQNLSSKIEFELKYINDEILKKLNANLTNLKGIDNYKINTNTNRLYLETNLPTLVMHQHLEKLIENVIVLRGMGTIMDSAVCELMSDESRADLEIRGVIRLVQLDKNNCAIDGTIDGLETGEHALNIFENGDLSNYFNNLGNHYNPTNKKHGLYNHEEKHVGDLGNIHADENGRAIFRFVDKNVKLWDIIGRSICISEKPESINQDSGEKLACGIIARSSKIFENVKKICLCSGKTLWDERKQSDKFTKNI